MWRVHVLECLTASVGWAAGCFDRELVDEMLEHRQNMLLNDDVRWEYSFFFKYILDARTTSKELNQGAKITWPKDFVNYPKFTQTDLSPFYL